MRGTLSLSFWQVPLQRRTLVVALTTQLEALLLTLLVARLEEPRPEALNPKPRVRNTPSPEP